MKVTTEDIKVMAWGREIVLPKGTAVSLVKSASGTEGDLYAVHSVGLLIALTGNSHDPKYRYLFVPSDKVGDV